MENDRKRTALLQAWPPLLVIAASLAPYLGILDAPFVFDDIKLVKENQFLRLGLKDAGKVFEALDVTARRWDDEELRPNYRPLRFLSYLVDYQLTRWWFKGSPPENPPEFFFHLSNLLLHSLNSLLLFFLARRLFGALFAQDASGGGKGEGRSAFAALSTALFFALHPLQTEAVTYVSGRRDVLSTFFFLLALWVYLRARPDRPSALDIVLVPALFAAGFFSKEMAITLPAALLLVDWVRGVAWSGRRAALHALTWLVAALLVAITLFNPRLIAKPDGSGAGSLVLAAFTAARYVSRYLGLLLCPVSQSVDYSFDAVSESTSLCAPWTTLPSVLFVVLLISLAAGSLLRRRGSPPRSVLALGILWFVGTLVPVLQFVPIAEHFAERFSYLPSIGVFFVLALFLERAWRLERVLGWGLLGILSLIGREREASHGSRVTGPRGQPRISQSFSSTKHDSGS